MKIRKALQEDAEQILNLLNSTEELKTSENYTYTIKYVYKHLKNPMMYVSVCENRGKIIGFLIAEIWKENGYSFLNNIAAHKDHRGKGCGSLLFDDYEQHCRKLGLKSMSSLVRTDNKGMQAWSKNKGYKKGHALYYYEKKLI